MGDQTLQEAFSIGRKLGRPRRSTLNRMIEERDETLERLRWQVAQGETRLAEAEQRAADLKAELEQAGSVRGEVSKLKQKASALERARDERVEEMKALKGRIKGFQAQVSELESSLEEARAALQAAQEERDAGNANDAARWEHEVKELQLRLQQRLDQEAEYERELGRLRAELEEARTAPPPSPLETMISELVGGELAAVLESAKEAAARMVGTAESERDRTKAEAVALWQAVQDRMSRYSGWREQAEPRLRAVAAQLEVVRSMLREVPGQLEAVLAPAAELFAAVDGDVGELMDVWDPPLLEVPSSLGSMQGDPPEEPDRVWEGREAS
ncbi:MAG TPA: hypothetical protein VKA30_08500 [Actinomycetota bacterium]|nr:hypothetical protein [Actinomycetota bacterium]